MSYVIFNNNTLKRYKSSTGHESWNQKRTAKAVRTKAKLGDEWIVASYEEWVRADPYVEVKSIMNGKPISIRKSSVGNPAADPSMEGYWQM